MNNLVSQQDFEVRFGSIQNPYQEMTFTILAGQQMQVNFAHNYFRVISLSGGTLQTRFGASGQFSPYTGAGLGFKIPFVVPQMVLLNSHAADTMTVTIAVAIGEIMDDRLQTSGTVTVSPVKAATNGTVADVTLTAGAATIISAASANRRACVVTNLSLTDTIRVGDSAITAARGEPLLPQQKTVVETTAAVYAFNANATLVAIRTESD